MYLTETTDFTKEILLNFKQPIDLQHRDSG